MRILGIDPGTAIMGFGLIEKRGERFKVLDYGCWRTSTELSTADRLVAHYNTLCAFLDTHRPEHVAVETLFFNRNTKTALTVGQARGVVLLAGAQKNAYIAEYTPLQVKQAVVGYGKAEKKQVQFMVKAILGLPSVPQPDDAADALAIAVCHAHSVRG
ncbi:MAG: crossover junction endodeoxyribonuclease RuvC [Peptococcaceae bacterium]|nr:crossover junction endodeoxyribonuclease RuvC [Peptococcaceae bacterium]